ncbi:hypothetical protein FRB97_001946 [Tulasnella sp. 331]|nr:hypothetical protein FRB97_001946 [Tulasnella sp. 331]
MFFSSELLLKRESGYGLLWLAATIGAKASFKKLNKRSIVSADIGKLCDLITNPEEHLALRLSSNLLIGVARVHRAQHEIFYQDVMTAYATLKRAFAEITSDNLMHGQLVMKKDQVTLEETTYALDFDFPDAYWIDAVPRAPSPLPSQENDFFVNHQSNLDAPASQTSSDRRKQHLLEDQYPEFSGGPSDDPSNRDEFLEFGAGGIDLQLDDWDAGVVPPPTENEELGFQAPPQQDDMNANMNEMQWEAHNDQLHGRASSIDHLGVNPRTRLPSEDIELGNVRLSTAIAGSAASRSRFPSQDIVNEDGDHNRDMDEEVPQLQPRVARGPKRKIAPGGQALWDESIELTDDQLKDMRNGYEQRMSEEREVLRLKKDKTNMAQNIQNLMHSMDSPPAAEKLAN